MDNADLEKLSISPGKLKPKFHPNITEYAVILGSDVKQIKLDPLTSDSGASYNISGGGGGKTVSLKEGQVTSVKVEVTAEDGSTIKNYFVHVTRLSASDASLTDLKLLGSLCPDFSPSILSYTASFPFSCSSIEINPVVADKKATVKVNGNDPKIPLVLNYGETVAEVEVTSPDESEHRRYRLTVSKVKLPRPVRFVDKNEQGKFTCPICLGVLHRPKSIKDRDPKHVFCKRCIDERTRTSKQDPLDGSPLAGEWRLDECDLEKEMSSRLVHCVHKHWGCSERVKLSGVGEHVRHCQFRPVVVEKSGELVPAKDLEEKFNDAFKACPDCNRPVRTADLGAHKDFLCTSKHSDIGVKNKADLRAWEKKLQQKTSEKSAEKLVLMATEQVKQCFMVLPQHGNAGHFDGEVSPLRYLEIAAECIATAIKLSPKNAQFHFQLGQVLEEQHYVQDVYGIKPMKFSDDAEELDFNTKSKESSKEDDIQAICEMRGAGRNAPLSLQLKAIDEEYHYLLDQGQSDKADYVQKLYAWKSKQATQNKTAQLATNEEEPLGKAYLKYLDALSHSPDNHLFNLHVGRMLLVQNKPEEAVKHLEVAVGLKPTNIHNRFYLGLGLCQQKDGPGKRRVEAAKYLSEGLEYLLNQMSGEADDASKDPDKWQQSYLSSDNLLRLDNPLLLQGFICLGAICRKIPTLPLGVMPSNDAFLCAAVLASHLMSQLVSRGDTYHQVEWVLFEAHFLLLQIMLHEEENQGAGNDKVASVYCENLSSLIKCSTILPGKQLLDLQEKICQQAVFLQPCNSRALYRLGDAQLSCYDNDPASSVGNQVLQEAELSYRASIELEGSASEGGVTPAKLSQQRWFKERQAKLDTEKKAREGGAPQKATGAPAVKGPSAATRGGAQAAQAARGRGGSTARGGATGRGGAPPTRSTGSTTASKAATRGRTSPTKPAGGPPGRGIMRGGSSTAATKTPASTSKASSSTTTAHKHGACAPTKQSSPSKTQTAQATATEKPLESSPPTESKPSGPPNKSSYHARLGLARVLMRRGGEGISEAHRLYEEVISMAPTVHDAYIELADSLVKSEPMRAVDIYSKYPFKEPLTFDDAYIHGEIVRLLMKSETYDDQRLGPSMISLGRIMGLSVLEKYVESLDKTFKYSKLLKEVYAGVHGKSVDDPDLQQFFKFKCWV